MAHYARNSLFEFEEVMELYIGLMSGTSADGINAVLVDFAKQVPDVIATHYKPYPDTLRTQVLELFTPGQNEIERLGKLDILLAQEFAEAVNVLLEKTAIKKNNIQAIGCHGQTIRHSPNTLPFFTLQIGDPNTIAALTGITTVADFRRRDIALGGQGAPLVPGFHQHLFSHLNIKGLVNIGGIANVTLLNDKNILGFDTGPGNGLSDAWTQKHFPQHNYDANGAWARKGSVVNNLLTQLLADSYFKKLPPKSTGREYFNLAWLEKKLGDTQISAADIQRTLIELTSITIVNALKNYLNAGEILICGGGVHNQLMLERIKEFAKPLEINCTDKYNYHPDWIEAMAFAWLARQTINRRTGNLPSVTGAQKSSILGGVYFTH